MIYDEMAKKQQLNLFNYQSFENQQNVKKKEAKESNKIPNYVQGKY